MGILGPKTQKLLSLREHGFKVPPFFPIDSESLLGGDYEFLAHQAVKALACESYAVRSSALGEDGEHSSQAGQFLTLLDVSPKDLSKAIEALADDAQEKLGGLSAFSVLIQMFIEPDRSGVCFTRNPLGGREWILESHQGRGDRLVGGEIRPQQSKGYWNQMLNFPDFAVFKQIEDLFGSPQDIEWCVKDGELFLLQARPITTITKEDFEAIKLLEAQLPEAPFLYEKTEISEIAPYPDAETFALLEEIYSETGPIAKVYRSYGIQYANTHFLRLLDGNLYVDREREVKSLLPAFTYLRGDEILAKPRWGTWKGSFKTFMDLLRLGRLSANKMQEHTKEIRQKLGDDHLSPFTEDYALIFEINLISGFALKRLTQILKHFPEFELASLLQDGPFLVETIPNIEFDGRGLMGNSLDLADTSPFTTTIKRPSSSFTGEAWKNLSPIRQNLLLKYLAPALSYLRLREFARWLLIRHTNQLRPPSLRTGVDKTIPSHPKKLSSFFIETRSSWECLSTGEAEGQLINLEDLENGQSGILVTTLLSPDLVQYFPRLKGIVSEEGGLLSHLAIMAREYGLPVIAGLALKDTPFRLGDFVVMNKDGLLSAQKMAE